MEGFLNWIELKFDVLFSGLGVYVIGLAVTIIIAVIGTVFFKKKPTESINKVTMKNITAGGDVVGRDKKGS
ncbi:MULTISPECIES: hypothetical protein [Aeromonas]|uniref:hypothetical protein n=1 Tax=Aeromonas TaxID=642 RepID=UPI001C23304D|nr:MULTISPECIES: hypothetical protein [Aeromonas]MDX7697379.1 hypothetical protein [Aeromonas dhakensis]QXC06574.1 hypothetical protein I6L38_12535 [Aeromonas sp. FDAARGOS 1408]BEE08471.1 hypothetical protein VAWG003_12800 [Aeromonas dhakensis]BEE25356.1 hypothetical protein VAWG005_12840 [Aeromonas dhakensis]